MIDLAREHEHRAALEDLVESWVADLDVVMDPSVRLRGDRLRRHELQHASGRELLPVESEQPQPALPLQLTPDERDDRHRFVRGWRGQPFGDRDAHREHAESLVGYAVRRPQRIGRVGAARHHERGCVVDAAFEMLCRRQHLGCPARWLTLRQAIRVQLVRGVHRDDTRVASKDVAAEQRCVLRVDVQHVESGDPCAEPSAHEPAESELRTKWLEIEIEATETGDGRADESPGDPWLGHVQELRVDRVQAFKRPLQVPMDSSVSPDVLVDEQGAHQASVNHRVATVGHRRRSSGHLR